MGISFAEKENLSNGKCRMKKLSLEELVHITGAECFHILNGQEVALGAEEMQEVYVNEFVIDSRKMTEHGLFVPFKGEKVDAHKFLPQVLGMGKVTLTEENQQGIADISGQPLKDGYYLLVESTLDAMQKIGAHLRSAYGAPIIGVTGSVGKTTTREMITVALSAGKAVFHTEGNNNSQIGVPLTLARILDEKSDVAVLEMGISEPGGMDKLTAMVHPTMAVVTTIGVSHIEFMKTREGIRDEKLKIIDRMDANGLVLLNADDDLLKPLAGKLKVKTYLYGTDKASDFRAENIRIVDGKQYFSFVTADEKLEVSLSQLGRHNVLNACAALGFAKLLGVDLKKAADALSEFRGLRQKVNTLKNGATLIDDAYNASPTSMKASIEVLRSIKKENGRSIAVLGDMFELGDNEKAFHAEVGQFLNEHPVDELLVVGNLSKEIAKAVTKPDISKLEFTSTGDAAAYLKENMKENDTVLVKASNGMHFAEIVKELEN